MDRHLGAPCPRVHFAPANSPQPGAPHLPWRGAGANVVAMSERAPTLAELVSATLELPPGKEAIEYLGQHYNWGEVQRVAAQTRAALASAGIGDGAVSFVPRNRPSALAALTGMLADGRTVRMVYAFQSPAAIAAAIVKLDSPAVVLAGEDFTAEVQAALKARHIAAVLLTEMTARLHPDFASARPRRAPEQPSVDILTSGTTGAPKQFPILHEVFARYVLNQGMTFIEDPSEPPFLFTFPIGNISGMYSTCAGFFRGKRVLLADRFSVPVYVDYVKRFRPASGGAPPAAVSMILDAKVPKADLASIKYFSTGAAPLDPTVQRRFEETYGIPVILSYGATEFGGPVVAMTPALHAEWGEKKFGSVGRPMPGVSLRLRDADSGEVLPLGNEGVLEVVSPRMGPEWIRTSDIVFIDADGFVFCRGRNDGAIMRGGFKVLPETIERALLLHPAVSAAGVVGVPDVRLHEVPAAAILLKPGADDPGAEGLKAHLRETLMATHIPVHWMFLGELPKNASFKIDRPGLKRMFVEAG